MIPPDMALKEQAIMERAEHTYVQVFGDREEVEVDENDPRYEAVQAFFSGLIAEFQFPTAANGSAYVDCQCEITPSVHIIFPASEPLIDDRTKVIRLAPLEDPILGRITQEATVLQIRNIHMIPGAPIRENEFSEDFVRAQNSKPGGILLKKDDVVGQVDIDPTKKITQILANITLYEKEEEQVCEVEVQRGVKTLVIELPKITVPLGYDGKVTLPNGTTFSIEQFIGSEKKNYLGRTFDIPAPFERKFAIK